MFGSAIDYWLLRPLTHNRNLATEEQLNSSATRDTVDLDAAIRRVQKLQDRLEGRFPIRPDFRYLDIGCGCGDITMALARLGAGKVTGMDFVPRCISAAAVNLERLQLSDRVEFVCEDIHHWTPPHRYDVILSHEALEHIREPRNFLDTLSAFVEPHGIVVLAFGPLFASPFGDHMGPFFRAPIPWRGVLFSEQAILRLRREQYRPTDRETSYQNISGGLNLLRYSEFLQYVNDTGWTIDFLAVNPQLRKFPLLHRVSNALVRAPRIRNYFASSVYAILRPARPDQRKSDGAVRQTIETRKPECSTSA